VLLWLGLVFQYFGKPSDTLAMIEIPGVIIDSVDCLFPWYLILGLFCVVGRFSLRCPTTACRRAKIGYVPVANQRQFVSFRESGPGHRVSVSSF